MPHECKPLRGPCWLPDPCSLFPVGSSAIVWTLPRECWMLCCSVARCQPASLPACPPTPLPCHSNMPKLLPALCCNHTGKQNWLFAPCLLATPRVAFCNLLIILHTCDLLLQTLNMPSDMHQLRQAGRQPGRHVSVLWGKLKMLLAPASRVYFVHWTGNAAPLVPAIQPSPERRKSTICMPGSQQRTQQDTAQGRELVTGARN